MSNFNLPLGCTWEVLEANGKKIGFVVLIVRDGKALRASGHDAYRGTRTVGEVKAHMLKDLTYDWSQALTLIGQSTAEYEQRERVLRVAVRKLAFFGCPEGLLCDLCNKSWPTGGAEEHEPGCLAIMEPGDDPATFIEPIARAPKGGD